MKVILTKDVLSLGEAGDIVDVADGYARNYLLPSSMAEKATPGALKKREQNLARIKAKAEKMHNQAMQTAEEIKNIGKIEIQAKAGERGKLYGAITTRQLAQIIMEKSGFEVDRRNITVSSPINQVGEYKVNIKLTSKVAIDLPVIVSPDHITESMEMTEEYAQEMEALEREREEKKEKQQEQYKESYEEYEDEEATAE